MSNHAAQVQGIQVAGSNGRSYTVHQARDAAWVCSCPAWKFQRGVSGAHRTCKHINKLAMQIGNHAVAALK